VGSEKDRFAKFNAVAPLALLHLAAVMEGRSEKVPVYEGGVGFFAAAYGGEGHKYDEFLYRRGRG
jgi:hypothetical protein